MHPPTGMAVVTDLLNVFNALHPRQLAEAIAIPNRSILRHYPFQTIRFNSRKEGTMDRLSVDHSLFTTAAPSVWMQGRRH
jgi:hypothetical protein